MISPRMALLLGTILAMMISGLQPAAAVHSDYVVRTWNTEDPLSPRYILDGEVQFREIGDFTSVQSARLASGAVEVTNLQTEQPLSLLHVGTTDFTTTCDAVGIVNWNTVRWGPDNPDYAGRIFPCTYQDGTIHHWDIEYSSCNCPDGWYFGQTGTGEDQAHWMHTVLHEFGHGIGFGIGPAPKSHFTDSINCPRDGTNRQEIMCNFWYTGKDYPFYRPSERGVFGHAYS